MAAAGMLVVTNTFETKTAAALAGISPNLIAAEPTVEAIAKGVRDAVARAEDVDGRVRAAALGWSRDWDDSFSAPLSGPAGRVPRRMRVGVDGRSLVGPRRGIGHYAAGVLELLAAMPGLDVRVLRPRSRAVHGAAALLGRPRIDRRLGGVDVVWLPAPAPVAPRRAVRADLPRPQLPRAAG